MSFECCSLTAASLHQSIVVINNSTLEIPIVERWLLTSFAAFINVSFSQVHCNLVNIEVRTLKEILLEAEPIAFHPSAAPLTESKRLDLERSTQFYSPDEVFFCPEESHFYSRCLELFVFDRCANPASIVEFGTGDGSPVINSLRRTNFTGTVHGYEVNRSACDVACLRIEQKGLQQHYVIHNQSLFDGVRFQADYLIANPPYLPAPDSDICMPLLHGGTDGATLTKRLLTLNYDRVMLMVSSYSNPVETIEFALAHDYVVADFMVLPLKFGYYSSEPKVRNCILDLQHQQKAFFSKNIYFLAGILFQSKSLGNIDLSPELLKVMTAL